MGNSEQEVRKLGLNRVRLGLGLGLTSEFSDLYGVRLNRLVFPDVGFDILTELFRSFWSAGKKPRCDVMCIVSHDCSS